MIKQLTFLLFLFSSNLIFSQDIDKHRKEIIQYQNELNKEYSNKNSSPLTDSDRKNFEGHDYYVIDVKYRIEAKLERIISPVPFIMKTTTSREPTYEKYGIIYFMLDSVNYTLSIYRSSSISSTPGYEDYLFLPFTDLTNGVDTYSGGRYLDLRIPEGDRIVIDFNKAYNPYCAYNPIYSCPIPPDENKLNRRIESGIKYLH